MASKQNIAQYPNGFTDGVTIRGVPVLNTYSGQVWWVDASGAQIGDGKFNRPFATIDTAINHASAGDTILVKAGHTESLAAAAAIDADVAGISITGLGQGRRRPTISFTAAAADIDIDAANITIQNMVFDFTGVASLTAPIDVNAADFTFQGNEVIMSNATNQAVRGIVGATAADRMKIIGNKIFSTTAGSTSAINLVGTADGTEIIDNYIVGDFSVAAVENATGNVLTNLLIDDNYIRNNNVGNFAVELVSACTGAIQHNTFATDAIATAVDWGSCVAFDNTYFDTSDTDSNGTPIPLATTTGGVSLDNIQDALYGADGITTWPAAAAPGNAVSLAEGLRWLDDAVQGTNGVVTYPTAAAAANGVSIAEVLRYISEYQVPRVVSKAIAAWGTSFTTAASPVSLFTVTGNVKARVFMVQTTAATSTASTGTVAIGVSGNTGGLLAAVTANGTNFPTNAVWAGDTSPTLLGEALSGTCDTWFLVGNGEDIIATIATNNMTAGASTFYCEYIPLDSSSTVVAA